MAEPITGTMTFDGSKWKIVFLNEKDEEKKLFCLSNVFVRGFEPSKEGETEVDFERDNTPQKNACKVRLKGETWQGNTETEKQINYRRIKQQTIEKTKESKSFHKSYSDKPKENPQENVDMSKDFHNPYNFVPAIPRNHIDGKTNELGDREPHGHDRYLSEMLSGKLRVKMTVKTPLLLPDTARMIYDKQKDHRSFPVRVGADGKPFINPTAIKGMLRSAYEAVTNSRLSVFSETERLAFRGEASEALKLVPARIESEKVFLYLGENQIGDDNLPEIVETIPQSHGKDIEIREMYAAWLGEYKGHGKSYKGLDKHKNKVWAFITKWKHQKKFYFWNVVELQDGNLSQPTTSPSDTRKEWDNAWKATPLIGKWVKGFVCKTNRNFDRKHDERVFFMPDGKNPVEAKVADFQKLKNEWKRLIENYAEIHKGEPPPKNNQGQPYEWSRPISKVNSAKNESEKREETDLKDDTLCYAKVEKDGTDWRVLELYPVMISRRLHKNSPVDLLQENLKPASDIDELSPADRVFGCVIQNSANKKKSNAYRGQIRFGSVALSEESAKKPTAEIIHKFGEENEQNKWLPFNILGQPKPQQGRFYVAEDKNGNAQTSKGNNEESGYNSETKKGLRGRKVYPHHAKLPDDYWFKEKDIDFGDESNLKSDNQFREYLRPPSVKQQNNQNRSIEGWIIPQTKFEFDIHFTNLSEVELGALVWLLQLPENHFHRFGGGKPLGFGSVKLELSKYQISKGSELVDFYKSLDNELAEITKPDENKEAFEKTVKDSFIKPFTDEIEKADYQNIIESFLSACKGFTDKPMHYPRKRNEPNAKGEGFEWFVANSKTERGEVKNGYVLQNLVTDKGLPYLS